MRKIVSPRGMLIASMAIFGTIGPLVRKIPLTSGEIALYRAVLATLLIGGFLLITGQRIPFRSIKKELLLLLVSGAAIGFNWIFLFEAYRYTAVSVATLAYYFAPVIVMAVCPILFGERLTPKQILCFVMSTLGIVLITGTRGAGGGGDLVGILFGLLAAAFYATVVLLNKFIKNVGGIHRTFLQFLAAIAVLFPYVLLTDGFMPAGLGSGGLGSLLIVGLVHTGLTYCMYFSSLRELSGQKAAILSYIDPLVAVFCSVVILGEKMTVWQIVGGALILGFTLLNEIAPREKSK